MGATFLDVCDVGAGGGPGGGGGGGGGGGDGETDLLLPFHEPLVFAATEVVIDAFDVTVEGSVVPDVRFFIGLGLLDKAEISVSGTACTFTVLMLMSTGLPSTFLSSSVVTGR